MNKSSLGKIFFLIAVLMMLLFKLTSGQEGNIVKFQGIVMELNVKLNSMVVNEKQVIWNASTMINNEKGAPSSFDKLQVKSWVYVDGVNDPVAKKIVAKKLYLLTKYINAKEKSLYPFIQ